VKQGRDLDLALQAHLEACRKMEGLEFTKRFGPDGELDLRLILALQERNIDFIVGLVRNNVELAPVDRGILADILWGLLSGELTFHPHSTRIGAARKQRRAIRDRFCELHKEGWKPEAAVAQVHNETGKSERWLWNIRKEAMLFDDFAQGYAAWEARNGTHDELQEMARDCYQQVVALEEKGTGKRRKKVK
jgi:hypothetical protein